MSEQSLKLGFIMGLLCPSEKQVEKEPVAYSYNGVVLPKLPERDREKYPYVTIIKGSGYSLGGAYDMAYLCFSDTPLAVDDGLRMSNHSRATYVSYVINYTNGETDWRQNAEKEEELVAAYSLPSVLLPTPMTYTNYDAYYDEYAGDDVAGTLALAKSDPPIPIYE